MLLPPEDNRAGTICLLVRIDEHPEITNQTRGSHVSASAPRNSAYSGELVHRFRWKWSSVGESDAGLRT